MGELLALRLHNLPVKVVVYNNSSLNFIELEMMADGYVPFATELENPDYAKVAEAMGLWGTRVERSSHLPNAVEEFMAHDGPALLDVVTQRPELTIPPTITAQQVTGFSLYAILSMLRRHGTELDDLAPCNPSRLH